MTRSPRSRSSPAPQTALDREADLQEAIAAAQDELTALQGSVLNTYGLSDAERIKAEQKRAVDVVKAEAKVTDTQKKYGDWQADQQRQSQINQLQVLKQGLQDQLNAHKAAASAGGASTSAAQAKYLEELKAYQVAYAAWQQEQLSAGLFAMDSAGEHITNGLFGLGTSADGFEKQAKDGLKAGLDFSDWMKEKLIPVLQDIWKALEDVSNMIAGFGGILGSVVVPPLEGLNSLLGELGLGGILGTLEKTTMAALSPLRGLLRDHQGHRRRDP